jgi:DNA gyrase subunit A
LAKRNQKEKGGGVFDVGGRVEIADAGITIETPITEALRVNYMPYAMSVIVSRALPEIDGFKPAHRKLLYTMYNMGLLSGHRQKSANVVGETMKLNPHGDDAIYDTLVRMSRGNETLLHPYVDSKGNFGKSYSRDMACAASRYTEVKLAEISGELFSDIRSDTVDFVDSYDNRMKEPALLPVTFPSILVNYNVGIAVGMASSICPFNLAEVCETAVALIKNPGHDIASTLKAPDFPGGGQLIYDEAAIREIYETGRGSLRIRSIYAASKQGNMIEITEIPPTTTVEAIMDKIGELVKSGRVREIADMRDETDLKGLRLTLDLKRGADPEKLMQKLFKLTPLEDAFACNFNLLVGGNPVLLGVRDILAEWTDFRRGCIKRRVAHELKGKEERLHLLEGLAKILLDIDKAIKIVRETEQEKDVVPNLMIGFAIDEAQANYIAEIKLRHLNREYIINRVSEREQLAADIAGLRETLNSKSRVDRIIMREQAEVAKKYVQARRTKIIYGGVAEYEAEDEVVPDYPVTVFYTRDGYFKKITPQSLRMSAEHKLKEGDEIVYTAECKNDDHLLFFTNLRQVYKCRVNDFEDTKASVIGDYVASRLTMQEGEIPLAAALTSGYEGYMLFIYRNGKAVRVPMPAFETKLNRKKLTGAYSAKGELANAFVCEADTEFALFSSAGRMLLLNSAFVPVKQAKDSQGVAVMSLKKEAVVERAVAAAAAGIVSPHRYRTRKLPSAGAIVRAEDFAEPSAENNGA